MVPDYPICNLLVAVGVFSVLAIEQGILIFHNNMFGRKNSEGDYKVIQGDVTNIDLSTSLASEDQFLMDHQHDGHDHGHGHDHNTRKASHDAHDHDHDHEHNEHCHLKTHDHDHAALPLDDLLNAHSFKELVSAYALEISTAIHSMVIGFDLGVLTDVRTASILCVVLAFHQFVEGLGLGAVLKASQQQLGGWKILSFVMIFSSTVSVGVILGVAIKPSSESDEEAGIIGAATAIAAGSLLYISLVEMTSEYFNLPELEKEGTTKICMLILYSLGVTLMAIIGIWA